MKLYRVCTSIVPFINVIVHFTRRIIIITGIVNLKKYFAKSNNFLNVVVQLWFLSKGQSSSPCDYLLRRCNVLR